jgi:hypothetical protein
LSFALFFHHSGAVDIQKVYGNVRDENEVQEEPNIAGGHNGDWWKLLPCRQH